MKMEEANSSQDLAPHTTKEGFLAFFFYALAHPISGAQPAVLCQVVEINKQRCNVPLQLVCSDPVSKITDLGDGHQRVRR